MNQVDKIFFQLRQLGVRVHVDDRDDKRPGWKYNYWELKGVPLRIELGQKDFQNKTCRVVKRNTGKKIDYSWDAVIDNVPHLLEEIQLEIYVRAVKRLDSTRAKVYTWKDFMRGQ